ncbi:MAG TPA: TonB-dependent receptor, partial [Vicinamibacteria bacterium]
MSILGLAFTLAASFGSAQETGSIGGIVTDATGAVLPGCIVEIESESGVLSRKQQTGARGGYTFSGLPIGTYRVRFELAGFDSALREGVGVETGSHVQLLVTLQLRGLAVVSVVGSSDRRSGLAEVAGRSLLEGVPTGRSLWSVLELTPGLVTDRIDVGGSESAQQPQFSAAGTSTAQNQYYLNGVNVTDPAALGASSSYYSYDAFEEVQVSTAAHDAEVLAPGAVLNIVLEGGANAFAGGAAFYFENGALQGDNLDDRLRAQGVPPSNHLDAFHDLSAELGGPLVRDRAFFYANYANQRIAPFAIGFFLPGGEPGVDRADLSTVVARTTLALATRGTLGFLFFQNQKLRPYRDASRFRPTPETALYQDSTTRVLQGLYSRSLGDEALLDARFGTVDLDFPLGEAPDLPPDAYSRIELANGVRSGGPGSDELFSRSRRQANAALFFFADDWLAGTHDLKFGWEGAWNRARTGFDLTGAVLYRDFFGAPIQVELYSEPLTTTNDVSNQGFFVKDSYVRGRWVLNLGARFDRWTAGYPDQSRSQGPWEDFFRARGIPESTAGDGSILSFSSIAPRLGFTYGLTSDGKTLLRGNYGRFYHQIGTDLVSSQNPNGHAAALFRFD